MLAFIRDANTSQSVIDIFDRLWQVLEPDTFRRLFQVVLGDNGSEFSNPSALETGDSTGNEKTEGHRFGDRRDLDSLVIEANVGEDFIKDVKIGADVLISPVADYSRTYRGTITRLSELAVVENGETVIPVEISFEQHDNFLLPHFNVDVKIYTD